MKIVNLKTLLAQPVGTIFADYRLGDVGTISIFGGCNEATTPCFVRAEIDLFNVEMEMDSDAMKLCGGDPIKLWSEYIEQGKHDPVPDFECWGGHHPDVDEDLFVLLDKSDVLLLHKVIAKHLMGAYGATEQELSDNITVANVELHNEGT